MLSRRVSKSLLFASSLVLLGVSLAGCGMKSGKTTAKGPSVTSLIQVSMRSEGNVQNSIEEFKIYKNTQAQLLNSPLVLTAALRKPEINSLSIFKKHQNDPVSWLQQNLKVTFPGDSEIMKVSLYDSNQKEAVKMLRAVVDAYLTEIVETERRQKAQELAVLDELLSEKERDIRNRRISLKALVEDLGTADPETLKLQIQVASGQLATHQQQLFQVESELRRLKAEREIFKVALKRLDKSGNGKAAADNANNTRPELRRVVTEMAMMANQLNQVLARLSDVELSQRLRNELADVKQKLDKCQQLLNARLSDYGSAELQEEISNLDIRIALANENVAELKEKVDILKKEFLQEGQSSVELEMMRDKLNNLELIVRDIAAKRQTLEIELNCRPRIRILQRAEASP